MATQRNIIQQCASYLYLVGKEQLADYFKESKGFCFGFFVAQRLAIEYDYEYEWSSSLEAILGWDGRAETLDVRIPPEDLVFLPEHMTTLRQVFDFVIANMVRHQSDQTYQTDQFYIDEQTGAQIHYLYRQKEGGLTCDLQGRPVRVKIHGVAVETFNTERLAEVLTRGAKVSPCLHVRNLKHSCGIHLNNYGEWAFYDSSFDVVDWREFDSQDKLIKRCFETLGYDLVVEPFTLKRSDRILRPISPALDRFNELAQQGAAYCKERALLLLAFFKPEAFCELLSTATVEVCNEVVKALRIKLAPNYAGYELLMVQQSDCFTALLNLAMRSELVANAILDSGGSEKSPSLNWLEMLVMNRPMETIGLFEHARSHAMLATKLQRNVLRRSYDNSVVALAVNDENLPLVITMLSFIVQDEARARAVCAHWKVNAKGSESPFIRHICALSASAEERDEVGLLDFTYQTLHEYFLYLLCLGTSKERSVELLMTTEDLVKHCALPMLEAPSAFHDWLENYLTFLDSNKVLVERLLSLSGETFCKVLAVVSPNCRSLITDLAIKFFPKGFVAFVYEEDSRLAELLKQDIGLCAKLTAIVDDEQRIKLVAAGVKLISERALSSGAVARFLASGQNIRVLFAKDDLNAAVAQGLLSRAERGTFVRMQRGMGLLHKFFPRGAPMPLQRKVFFDNDFLNALSTIYGEYFIPRSGAFFAMRDGKPLMAARTKIEALANDELSCSDFIAWCNEEFRSELFLPGATRMTEDAGRGDEKRRRGAAVR